MGLMAVGDALEKNASKGLLSAADRESERQVSEDKVWTQQRGNAINTLGSAVGVAAIGAVKLKKSGILNDIF